jgi:tRNA/rRNA methyltransferase
MAAVHAGDLLRAAQVHDSVAAVVSDASWVVAVSGRDHEYAERKSVLGPDGFIRRLRALPAGARCVLLFGSERFGLTNAQARYGQDILTFPTSERYPSMNLAQAVAITAWEIRRADLGAGLGAAAEPAPAAEPKRELVTAGQIEGLMSHLRRSLGIVGFLNPQNPELILDDLRRMVARAALDPRELAILRGVLHRLDVWIASHGGPPTLNQERPTPHPSPPPGGAGIQK